MARLTLNHMRRKTRLPQVLGYCVDDAPNIADAINAAQERLIFAIESGDQGWYGTWARMVFNVLPSNAYITLGRYGSRLMNVAVCRKPFAVANEFSEFLEFGNGILPTIWCGQSQSCAGVEPTIVARGEVPSFRDLAGAGRLIRVRALDPLDTISGKRVLIQGTDAYDNIIYSLNVTDRITGVYLTVADPFVDTPMILNSLTGIQKDVTAGQIQFYDVDPVTAEETLILTMEPSETVAGYKRYVLNNLPPSCCPQVRDIHGNLTVQVEALVKLNYIPVVVDSDYLLLQNSEAIIAECQSARYSTMDDPNAKKMAMAAHKDAIRLLQGELAHQYGTDNPAIGFYPFGSARLERQGIGLLI